MVLRAQAGSYRLGGSPPSLGFQLRAQLLSLSYFLWAGGRKCEHLAPQAGLVAAAVPHVSVSSCAADPPGASTGLGTQLVLSESLL